jgi:8-oxo-dGTP pyrophosphatase MutT (NUDIX family)
MKIKRPPPKQPLPPHAKRVFKGVIFDVYQWEQTLFDGSKATFEKIKRPDTVNVIPVTSRGEIILARQQQPGKKPFLGVLGGRIEKGETPLAAAKRELLEESGYEAKEFLLWDAVQPSSTLDWAIYTFIAKRCSKKQESTPDAGEKIELSLVSFEDYLKIISRVDYRDLEIALKLLRLKDNPRKLAETKTLFLK